MNRKIKTIYKKLIAVLVPSRRIAMERKERLTIGEKCELQGVISFGTEPYLITIGNNVRITHGVTFVTHDGGMWVLRNLGIASDADLFGKILIGNNVHIGEDVTIMPNVRIGNNVVIGCGAVVTKDIPDNSVAVGIPARVIESIDEYYEKNKVRIVNTKHMSRNEKKRYLMNSFMTQ